MTSCASVASAAFKRSPVASFKLQKARIVSSSRATASALVAVTANPRGSIKATASPIKRRRRAHLRRGLRCRHIGRGGRAAELREESEDLGRSRAETLRRRKNIARPGMLAIDNRQKPDRAAVLARRVARQRQLARRRLRQRRGAGAAIDRGPERERVGSR